MSVWLGPGVSRDLARPYSGVSVTFPCGISIGVCRLSEADETKGGRRDADVGHHLLCWDSEGRLWDFSALITTLADS